MWEHFWEMQPGRLELRTSDMNVVGQGNVIFVIGIAEGTL